MDLYSSDVGQIQEGNMRSQRVMDANKAVKEHNDNLGTQIANLRSSNQTGDILEATKDATGQFWATGKLPSQVKAYKEWTATKLASNPTTQAQNTARDLTSATTPPTTAEIPSVGASAEEEEAGGLFKKGIKSFGMSDEAIDTLGKGAGALASVGLGGMDAYKEIESLSAGKGLAGDNWASKTADIGQIAGAIADVGGTVFPPLALVGGAIDLASGAFGEIGDMIDSGKQNQSTKDLQTKNTLAPITSEAPAIITSGRVS